MFIPAWRLPCSFCTVGALECPHYSQGPRKQWIPSHWACRLPGGGKHIPIYCIPDLSKEDQRCLGPHLVRHHSDLKNSSWNGMYLQFSFTLFFHFFSIFRFYHAGEKLNETLLKNRFKIFVYYSIDMIQNAFGSPSLKLSNALRIISIEHFFIILSHFDFGVIFLVPNSLQSHQKSRNWLHH